MDDKTLDHLESLHNSDDFDDIIKIIKKIPRDQWDYDLIAHLARAYNNVGEYDKALKLLTSCKAEGINDPNWHFRVGYAHFYNDDNELARASFKEALRLRPSDEDAVWFLNELEEG
jgi:tetratricopeptide (TPR) repeat protein